MKDLNLVMRTYTVQRDVSKKFADESRRQGQSASAMLRKLMIDFVNDAKRNASGVSGK